MKHPLIKFLLVFLVIMLIVGLVFKITNDSMRDNTAPERIASFEEAVPPGFATSSIDRVLDPRDAGILLEPKLSLVKVSDRIVAIGCPSKHPICITIALFKWTNNEIEFIEVLPTRDHIISPQETILLRQGNSLTKSILLGALLKAQGIDVRVGITPYVSFAEANVMGEELRLDPSCSGCLLGETRYKGSNETIIWIS